MDERQLKIYLHSKATPRDKLLAILAHRRAPSSIAELRESATRAGWRKLPANPSNTLARAAGLAIRSPEGWELSPAAGDYLTTAGITGYSAPLASPAVELRTELQRISDAHTRSFVEEAVKCYENDLHRAAIVMSWCGAVSVLQNHVFNNNLQKFNTEGQTRKNWQNVITIDDFSSVKEFDFLQILYKIGAIPKNTKDELEGCLRRRNGCGHPNTFSVGKHAVAHHLETLILNVFRRY